MPQRGILALALIAGCLLGACRRTPETSETPEVAPKRVDDEEKIDVPRVCESGCRRLQRCVPELAGEVDGDPTQIAERLAATCADGCADYQDRASALALRDCLKLDSCEAYWGCVGTATVRPWLATVAPVGERTCANLCSQASACAIAQACTVEAEPGKRPRPGKPPKGEAETPSEDQPQLDATCMQDQARRDELEERCLLQCEATAETSRARTELIGCIDHASCAGMLRCLDSWSATNYADIDGPTPGISETCDGFCTRAIVCGAAEQHVELEPRELQQLKQDMTSTYVECAVQCGKELETSGDTARAAFERCTAVETCEAFSVCAKEM